MNNRQQERYIKHQMNDIRHARFAGWQYVVTSVIFILALIGLAFLQYATVDEQSTSTTVTATFWEMTLGTARIGDSYVGRPNVLYICEIVAFIVLSFLPAFFKKHIKGALVVTSLLLLALFALMWFNLPEGSYLRLSFDSSTDANASRSYVLKTMNVGYYLIPFLTLILVAIDWLTYALIDKRVNEQLFVDAKVGKKLANY